MEIRRVVKKRRNLYLVVRYDPESEIPRTMGEQGKHYNKKGLFSLLENSGEIHTIQKK